jgi:tRNA (cytidine/uridine-2'-O-)-methyltransferase
MESHPGVVPQADPPLRIVLVEPEIPGNTGTIGRLAMGTRCPLHLVRPLGFRTDEKALRRAGLDYWRHAEVYYHDAFAELPALFPSAGVHLLTTHAARAYTSIPFRRGDLVVFGKETSGLGEVLLSQYPESSYCIPMWDGARSLNLAVAVGIVVYEGLRQLGLTASVTSAPTRSGNPDGG